MCILLSQTVAMADAHPTVEPWCEPVLHRFDKTHVRWVPIVPPPPQEASDENVIAMATGRGIGQFTIPLLAEFGQPSQQPNTSGSAEPAAVATETLAEVATETLAEVATETLAEVVAMTTDPPEDLLPPLPESPVVEDDTILVGDNHNMPNLAKMVE